MSQDHPDIVANWHTSSYSGENGDCVEVATNLPRTVPVRDTKHAGAGPVLRFPHAAWGAFLAGQGQGQGVTPAP